jgi:transposase
VALANAYTSSSICEIDNSADERALRSVATGRRNFLFAGGERAAAMYGLIETARLNGFDSEARLLHVLARIADHPVNCGEDFLPCNCADKLSVA